MGSNGGRACCKYELSSAEPLGNLFFVGIRSDAYGTESLVDARPGLYAVCGFIF